MPQTHPSPGGRAIHPASLTFTVLLGVFAALPALSIDMSAPTLLLLPAALHTTTTMAGLTLSLFMAGFAMGQFIGGAASDGRGRRPVLLAALACYTAAGLACALATSGPGLVASRAAQGLGAGACSVMAFAMVQDLFEGEAARSKRAYVTVVFGLVPVLAPALGAAVSAAVGWRAVPWLLALAGCCLLAVSWMWVGESRWHRAAPAAHPGAARPLWHDRRFVALSATNALSYSVVFAYIAGSPVVVMGWFGLTPGAYALIFACTATALTGGSWAGGRLARRGVTAPALLDVGLGASGVATLTMAGVGAAAFWQAPPWVSVAAVPLMLVVMFARGISGPNLQHLAVERQPARAGAASAAVGVSQLALGAVSSSIMAVLLPRLGPLAVSGAMALLGMAALLTWVVEGRR